VRRTLFKAAWPTSLVGRLIGFHSPVARLGGRQLVSKHPIADSFIAVTRALSEQRSGVCAWRSTPRPKRPLGRESAPLGQCAGSSLFVDLASDEMALLIEVVVDLGMN
jgi:hypothetical protein